MDAKKALLHAKRWDVYVNEKGNIIKGWFLVELIGSDERTVLWEVVDDHAAEEEKDHPEIGLWGVDFNSFDKDK